MAEPLLIVEGLRTTLATRAGPARAVDGVDLRIDAGEIVGLVGESGCGKSMTAMSIMGLVPSTLGHVSADRMLFAGQDLLALPPARRREIRGRQMAMVFQDPMTFLNPVLTIGAQLEEMLRYHLQQDKAARRVAVRDLLARVRIPDPDRVARAYPHQLSGGMRQRVLIAIALSCGPRLIIADEPTTALDVTVQAQVLTLLKDLVRDTGAALLLITHDLGVVAETCDRVTVMYAGKAVESAPVDTLFAAPRHPYTRALLRSVLRADQRREGLYALEGSVPDLTVARPGCGFCDRCDEVAPVCHTAPPPWILDGAAGVACWARDQ